MSHCTQHPNGWISLPVDEKFERMAQRIREERDRKYVNLFREEDSDLRWVGELGEMVFKSWLRHSQISDFEWLKDDVLGRPDFIIEQQHRIGIKTVKRQYRPLPSYAAGMSTRHIDEPVDHFFFMTYLHQKREMWLLGGIERDAFIRQSTHYSAGDYVHPKYRIRPGHEINNIDVDRLKAPLQWLDEVLGRCDNTSLQDAA